MLSDLPEGLLTPKRFHIPWGWIAFLGVATFGGITVSISVVQYLYASKISTITRIQPAPVAIVLGASVNSNGTPSDALNDRILTAVDLYKQNKVSKLLMTGDDGKNHADEVDVMARVAMDSGVPEEAILKDGKGYRTFESCSRAIGTFNITKAIIVTQRFHMSRALFLCNELGIDASGVTADRQTYKNITWFKIRDLLASAKAFWDVYGERPASPVKQSVAAAGLDQYLEND